MAFPHEQHNGDVVAVLGHSELVIENLSIPADGIEINDTGVTTYAINVHIRGGAHYVLKKRYSEMRVLHESVQKHLKSTHAADVKRLKFPRKHFMINSTLLEKRRRELEKYFCVLLEISPLPRSQLFNFLDVNANVEEFECVQLATSVEVENNSTEEMNDEMLTQYNEVRLQSDEERSHSSTPATHSVHLNTGHPRPDDSSIVTAYQSSALMELIEMCFPMDEFRGMSEAVVARLIRTQYRLDEVDNVSSDKRAAFAQICQRFHAFLNQYADWLTIIERIARAPTLTRQFYAFNDDLDAFNCFMDREESNWKAAWSDMTCDVEECLISNWKANVGSLYTEFPAANSQHDAIINENGDSELSRSLSAHEQFVVAAEIVERMSDGTIDATIESVPDRFIHDHEVQRDPQPFSSGSSGRVYRGVWRGAKVVIKCVEVNSQNEMDSFLHEDKIWHMARHPNVVAYYGACHLSRPCFLVSEDAANGSSIDFIANEKRRGRLVMWGLMYGTALATRFLHKNGIVHGDLRCRNIVVDANEVAKLVDFGMSTLNGSSPTTHVGPIRWAAPECVVRNQASSFHSDTYSLGMCIIEAAIGCDPWGQLSDTGIHYELAHRRFLTQPAQLNDEQWRLVTSLCAFESNQRCTLDYAIGQLEAFALTEANADTAHLQTSS